MLRSGVPAESTNDSIRARWREIPTEWDADRVSQASKSVRYNWAAMTERMRDLVREYAASGSSVRLTDVGCGAGGFADGLQSVIAVYVGVDPSLGALSKAASNADAQFIQAVGEQLPLSDATADIVVLKSVLMHCYDPEGVLREAGRIMKVGGLCIVSVSNARSWYARPRRLLAGLSLRWGRPTSLEGHLFRLDRSTIQRMMGDVGLEHTLTGNMGYLALPAFLDRYVPRGWIEHVAATVDRLGDWILPDRGGSLILCGTKRQNALP